jgi:signal transduction histidine kinase/CheY-like chemotaxis protein
MTADTKPTWPHILVVDDEPEVISFCRRVLARSGYAVSGETSPEQALQCIATLDIDLLVTDLRMPTMSGLDLIEAARRQRPNLVSVVITGYADTIDVAVRALRSGARDFLAKPFSIEELRQAVDHALHEAHVIREYHRLLTLMPLLDLSRSGVTARESEALLTEGLSVARRALEGVAACFYRWNPDREELRLLHRHGSEDIPLPTIDALATLLRSTSQAAVVTPQEDGGLLLKHPPQAIAPALTPAGLVGALLVARPPDGQPFGQSDLETLSIMANQIAALDENARLVRELKGWNQRLEKRVHEATEELYQAQNRLIRAERLAAIGQLGASIAHELRNPLGVISNSAYYLGSRIPHDDAKARRHLEIIENEIATSSGIITDLMSFARVRELETHPEDPASLVQSAVARSPIPPSISVHVQELANGTRVRADADRLRQILINLITNAVQAMPEGGALAVTTRGDNGSMVFEVADTGVGIPQDQLDQVFEPLYTTKAKGIGMGLAIVKMLVEAHRGTIDVESAPGQGTRFTVRIPSAAAGDLES